jgi:hypothetical protein
MKAGEVKVAFVPDLQPGGPHVTNTVGSRFLVYCVCSAHN